MFDNKWRKIIVLRKQKTGLKRSIQRRYQAFKHLGFCARDVFARSQKTDMARTNIGDDSEIWTCAQRHAVELMQMVHAHFAYDDLDILRCHKKRQRKPDQIVVVAWRCKTIEMRRHHAQEHVFGGCFAA